MYVAANQKFVQSLNPEVGYNHIPIPGQGKEAMGHQAICAFSISTQNKHCFMIKMNYPDILSHLIRFFFIQNVVGTIT